MITYAGIPLTIATPDQAAWIEANISPRDVYEFERAAFPGLRRGIWALPGFLPERPIKLNALHWPRGAARWAVGHFLITEKEADKLAGRNRTTAALPLVLTDGTNSHTVNLWALPTRPLSSFPSLSGWHLLTLVDDRFFWWEKAADISVESGTTTWAQLYAAVGSALGITLTHDAIDAAYIYPGRALSSRYEYLPLLLDAIAYNVGQRVIRRYNGTVHAQGPTAAATSQAQQLLVAWPKLAGGTISTAMIRAELPPKVGLSFPKWIVDGDTCEGQFSATDVHWEEATTAGTHPGTTKFLRDTAVAVVDENGTVVNEAELEALTARFAADWYSWQLGVCDVAYVGIRAWTPEGLSDGIEWSYYPGAVATRIQRPTWNDLTDSLNHSADIAAISSESTSGCTLDPPVGDIYIFIDNTFIENLFVTNVDIDVLNVFNTFNVFNVTINNFNEINIFNEYILCEETTYTHTAVEWIDCINDKLWVKENVIRTGTHAGGCYYLTIVRSSYYQAGCCECPEDSDSDSTSEGSTSEGCQECCGKSYAPSTWQLFVLGVEDGTGVPSCPICEIYNGGWTLSSSLGPSCFWASPEVAASTCFGYKHLVVDCDEDYLYAGVWTGTGADVIRIWRIALEDVDYSGGVNTLTYFDDGVDDWCVWFPEVSLVANPPCDDAPPPPPPPPPPECCEPAPPDILYFNVALAGGGTPQDNVWWCLAQSINENVSLVRDPTGVWLGAANAKWPATDENDCNDSECEITIALFCKLGKWFLRFSTPLNLFIANLDVDSCDPFTLSGKLPSAVPTDLSDCFPTGGSGEAVFSITEDAI